VAIKSGGWIGLCINSALPSEIILPPSCEIYAEMRSIGRWGRFERIWATTSKPLSLGITRSVMTRSMWYLLSNDSAWSPSAASTTCWPSLRSASANAFRVMASSSTRRITSPLYRADTYENKGFFCPVPVGKKASRLSQPANGLNDLNRRGFHEARSRQSEPAHGCLSF
jgi:hypothetical protein